MSNDELSEFHLLDWKGSRDREGISTGTPYKYSYGRTHSLVQLAIMSTLPTQASYFESLL